MLRAEWDSILAQFDGIARQQRELLATILDILDRTEKTADDAKDAVGQIEVK